MTLWCGRSKPAPNLHSVSARCDQASAYRLPVISLQNPTSAYRLGVAVAVMTGVFLVLSAGALGIIGAGGRPDRIYAGVLVVGVLGTALARLRPAGMAIALAATASAQALITLTAFLAGLHHTEGASVLDILMVNAMFVAGFGLSAWLFRRAAEQRADASDPVPTRSR